jgi:hypothetical protein
VVHGRVRGGHSRPGAAVGVPSWFTMRAGARHGTRCGQASGAGMELRPDGRCLRSRIWHGTKGVACVGRGRRSYVRTDAAFQTSGR